MHGILHARTNYLQVIEEESGVGQVEDHLLHPQAEGHRFGRVLQDATRLL